MCVQDGQITFIMAEACLHHSWEKLTSPMTDFQIRQVHVCAEGMLPLPPHFPSPSYVYRMVKLQLPWLRPT